MATLRLNKVTPRVEKLRANTTTAEGHAGVTFQASAWLETTYPKLFTKPVPLKVGIIKELLQSCPPNISQKAVRRFIATWVNRPAYLKCCQPGASRWGLTGPRGKVTAHQARYAYNRLTGV